MSCDVPSVSSLVAAVAGGGSSNIRLLRSLCDREIVYIFLYESLMKLGLAHCIQCEHSFQMISLLLNFELKVELTKFDRIRL